MEKSSLLKKKRERGNQLEQIMVTERGMWRREEKNPGNYEEKKKIW
jgi:hypothetical protein